MDLDQLEQWLAGGIETQNFDVKESMPWDRRSFAKHILALANVRDGGHIVIGVKDDFTRVGIEPEDEATYKIDEMRDQMAAYADPHVLFGLKTLEDEQGFRYLVITVEPFRETPVICRKDDERAGVRAGAVYYRNRDKRVQSAPVSNSYDLREIILTSVARTKRDLLDIGILTPEDRSETDKQFEKEREGL